MNGWIDLVRISDGAVILSKELKHVTGNITSIMRTGRDHEIILATQRGVYFALIGRGLGLMEVEIQRFERTQAKFSKPLFIDQDEQSMRIPEATERAEMTTAGPKVTDLEGMSQMSFHTHSQFGHTDHNVDAGSQSSKQGSQSVFTKPFTVASNKGSEKSKLAQSQLSKPGTEAPRNEGKPIMKKKDRQPSDVPEHISENVSHQEPLGTI